MGIASSGKKTNKKTTNLQQFFLFQKCCIVFNIEDLKVCLKDCPNKDTSKKWKLNLFQYLFCLVGYWLRL